MGDERDRGETKDDASSRDVVRSGGRTSGLRLLGVGGTTKLEGGSIFRKR